MKPRNPSALTSPAPCGAFLYLSASPCNRAAQAPPLPRAAALLAALPLSPFGPVPPRLGQADKPRRRFPLPDQSKPRRRPLVPPFDRAALVKPRPDRPPRLGRHGQPLCRPTAGPVPPRKGGNPRRRCPTVAAA